MDRNRTPPTATLHSEPGGEPDPDREELRAAALRRARLSVHMRRHDRPLVK